MTKACDWVYGGLGLADVVAADDLVVILSMVNSVAHVVCELDISNGLDICKHPTLGMMSCNIDNYPLGVVQSELAWSAM